MSLDGFPDLCFAGVWFRFKKGLGREYDSGRTVATLDSKVIDEGLLQGMQFAVLFKALDRGDLFTIGPERQS